ncbi:unnamed protein product, partial [Ectocarpus sp. 12 AP-2014]
VIIAGDLNGWRTEWGSTQNNWRGNQIYEFIVANRMILLNDGLEPTFDIGTRQSCIDLTFVNSKAIQHMDKWKVVDVETCSDHRLICFQWLTSPEQQPSPPSLTRKFKTRNVDWTRFNILSLLELYQLDVEVSMLESRESIDQFVEQLTEKTVSICMRSLPLLKPKK